MGSKRKSKKGGKKKNPKGYQKGDKIHGRAKGSEGIAIQYLTRAEALRKLQIPLADFRRLCILKGIYPRDPKKKSHGKDQTYYHAKDITFLAHEPLLDKFMELKTFMKKFKRLMGRKERDLAVRLEERKPKYTLNHLIRERYPSFEDAIRDLDDALSMLALFQSLPVDHKQGIPPEAVAESTRLYQEFQLYVIRAQALRKVFASIKGYYYQVEIFGQTVTWLSPHQFTQELPMEVDFKVMLTFLEFYRCLLKFVNFKLYQARGLTYPPKASEAGDGASAEVAQLRTEMREAELASTSNDQEAQEAEDAAAAVSAEFGEDSEEAKKLKEQNLELARKKSVFKGMQVFVSREVPFRPVYFTLLCGGARVGWDRNGSPFSAEAQKVTHQVVDRPVESLDLKEGREYLQPQWVLDSFNTSVKLPIAPYAPGKAPPPHLSPFVDDAAEGYVPKQREVLNAMVEELAPAQQPANSSEKKDGAEAGQKRSFEQFEEELKAESKGVWFSDFKEQKAAAKAAGQEDDEDTAKKPPTAEDEARANAKAMMSKKHKRLLQRIDKGKQQKKDAADTLMSKRRKIEKGVPVQG